MWQEETVEQPWRDPIVEEIRKIREAHAARFNYDVRAIAEDLMKRQDEGNRQIVSFSPRRPTTSEQPASQ